MASMPCHAFAHQGAIPLNPRGPAQFFLICNRKYTFTYLLGAKIIPAGSLVTLGWLGAAVTVCVSPPG